MFWVNTINWKLLSIIEYMARFLKRQNLVSKYEDITLQRRYSSGKYMHVFDTLNECLTKRNTHNIVSSTDLSPKTPKLMFIILEKANKNI